MARTDTLGHFLTDVADAIREKKGTSETIQASDFDTEIENLPSGADLSEYFSNEPLITLTENQTSKGNWANFVDALPPITPNNNVYAFLYQNFKGHNINTSGINVTQQTTALGSMFREMPNIVELTLPLNWGNTSSVTNFRYFISQNDNLIKINNLNTIDTSGMIDAFYCLALNPSLEEIDLSGWNFTNTNNIAGMFTGNASLKKLDIRTIDFSTITYNRTNAFSGVPRNCEIIVADQTQKNLLLSDSTMASTDLTNVKTVAEYEAEQSE